MYFFAAFCVTCYVCNQLHISTYFLVFYHFFFFLLSFLSVLFVAIVSHCPYYPSSHASVKVREGSNYWGPLGYEALKSPKSSQSPDPRSASKRARMFTFRKRKDSKIPLCQGQKRWDFVLYLCVLRGEEKKIHTICCHFLGSLEHPSLCIYLALVGLRRDISWTSAACQPC